MQLNLLGLSVQLLNNLTGTKLPQDFSSFWSLGICFVTIYHRRLQTQEKCCYSLINSALLPFGRKTSELQGKNGSYEGKVNLTIDGFQMTVRFVQGICSRRMSTHQFCQSGQTMIWSIIYPALSLVLVGMAFELPQSP